MDGKKVFVIARILLRLVRGEVQVGVEDRERTCHDRGKEDVIVIVGQAQGRTVEAEVVVENDRGGKERIVEASDPESRPGSAPRLTRADHGVGGAHGKQPGLRPAAPDVVADVGAVEPDGVFAELAALALIGQTHRLVGRDRGVVVARGHAEAGTEVVTQFDACTEADEHAVTVAVLIGVPLRRRAQGESRRQNVDRRTCVDRIEVHESVLSVEIVRRIKIRLVAEADFTLGLELGEESGESRRRPLGTADGDTSGGQFPANVGHQLFAHGGGDVADAQVRLHFTPRGVDRAHAGLLGQGLIGHGLDCGDLRDGKHVRLVLHLLGLGFGLGLGDHAASVACGEHTALDEFVDQVDHHIAGRRGGDTLTGSRWFLRSFRGGSRIVPRGGRRGGQGSGILLGIRLDSPSGKFRLDSRGHRGGFDGHRGNFDRGRLQDFGRRPLFEGRTLRRRDGGGGGKRHLGRWDGFDRARRLRGAAPSAREDERGQDGLENGAVHGREVLIRMTIGMGISSGGGSGNWAPLRISDSRARSMAGSPEDPSMEARVTRPVRSTQMRALTVMREVRVSL